MNLWDLLYWVLSCLWAAACAAGMIMMVYVAWDQTYTFVGRSLALILVVGLGLPFAILLGALPWMFASYAASPDLATLKKAEWICSDSYVETTYVMSGKVMVPVTDNVCVQYSKL